MISSIAGKVRLFIVVMLGMTVVLSYLLIQQYESEFRKNHQQVAEYAVNSVNTELAVLLKKLRNDTRLFVQQNSKMLWQLSLRPDDEDHYVQISNLLTEYFPEHYAFTVTDREGNPYYSDMGETIGDQCSDTIETIISDKTEGHEGHEGHEARVIEVHPGPGEYHFDIVVPWEHNGIESGAFFISFHLNLLARVLKLGQPHSHSMMLIHEERYGLIEIGSEGGRDVVQLSRPNRLTESEKSRILYQQKLQGTRWVLVDLYNEGLMTGYRARLLLPFTFAWVAVLALSILSWLSINAYERKRMLAVQQLQESHDLLDKAYFEKTDKLTASNQQLRDETARRSEAEKMQFMLNTVVEQAGELALITDKYGIIEYVNAAFERITGYSSGEVIGKHTSMMKSGTMDADFYRQLWDTIRFEKKPFSGIFHNRKKDGQIIYVDQTISPLLDQLGDVEYYIATGRDITQDSETREKLRYVSEHDLLTGVYNIEYLENHLTNLLLKYDDAHQDFALVHIDVDRFSKIVAESGRQVSDQVLVKFTRQLGVVCGESDILARISGDEFMLFLNGICNLDELAPQINRIIKAIARPITINDHSFRLTASMGVAMHPHDGGDIDSLFQATLVALKRAKEHGGGSCEFYQEGMSELATAQIRLERQLNRAIENRELTYFYQPKVDIHTGELVGFEALARWYNKESESYVSPEIFIPILEANGLIGTLCSDAIMEACRVARDVLSPAGPGLRMAINLSMRQITDSNLPEQIKKQIDNYQITPAMLEFEITENLLIADIQKVTTILDSLSDLGCHISIDDFGTGYSSMQYLRLLPIETIKIDKTFVSNIHTNGEDRIFAKTIVDMSHVLDKQVVAEGVENRQQLEILREMDCDSVQGFLISEPMPAEELQEWINAYDPEVYVS